MRNLRLVILTNDLINYAESMGLHAAMCSSIQNGIKTSLALADGGIVCCVGSLFLAAEVRSFFSSDIDLKHIV